MKTQHHVRRAGALLFVLVAAAYVSSVALGAATATASLAVSAQVAKNCTISTTPLAFAAYDPIVTNAVANLDQTGGIVITCTKGTTTNIGLDLGANFVGSVRMMKSGTDLLTYEIYSDSGRGTVWGNAAGSWLGTVAAPSRLARTFTAYGRVAAAQDVPVGNYTDTVVATVNF